MDSNYNLAGLRTRIKDKLDDQEYPDDVINRFINDAYLDVLGDGEYQFLEKMYQGATQDGGVLPLPSNYQSLFTLTATDNHGTKALEYMPKEDYFTKGKGGKPYRYTIFADQLFYDLPSIENEEENGEEQFYDLRLYYLAKPKMLVNDADKPLIPYEFGEILVLGALARCERRRDNFDYAGVYEAKLDELVTNMKLRYCPRQLANENRAKLPVIVKTRH